MIVLNKEAENGIIYNCLIFHAYFIQQVHQIYKSRLALKTNEIRVYHIKYMINSLLKIKTFIT